MKKLLFFIILAFFVSCNLGEANYAKLIEREDLIVLRKAYKDNIYPSRKTFYYFQVYFDTKLYLVEVDYDTWNRYDVKDTLHNYSIVPEN